ncbi:MAG: polysaccharide deacetylase family protein [Candidatus Omnitrophica bacterium]|nr:polysaccharide deacetylase family protein [Candidatus Omnitrophota bacterium]
MSAGVAAHPALLLMRDSPMQTYCANTLFRRGIIRRVVVEDGSVGEPEGWRMFRQLWRYGPGGVGKRLARDLAHFDGRLPALADYYVTRLRTRRLVNHQPRHEARLLGPDSRRLEPALRAARVPTVNDPRCRQLILEEGARLVFVFGTGLLKDDLLSMEGVTFVNLHHGWLPAFRGEGILSALAEEGVGGLGVTVHIIDRGIDTGPILYRERLAVEAGDNAYALALKATIRGTALFQRVYDDAQRGELRPTPQPPDAGRCYGGGELKTRYRMRLAALRALDQAKAAAPQGGARLRSPLARGCMASGLTILARRRHGRRLRILMYHGVVPSVRGPAGYGDLFVSADDFDRQLRHLARAFTVISLEEAIGHLVGRRPFPERAVAVTFDDGYRNVVTTAWPILKARRVPATVFVPAALAGQPSVFWFDALRILAARCAATRTAARLGGGIVVDGRAADMDRALRGVIGRIGRLPLPEAEGVAESLTAQAAADGWPERYPEFALASWEEWRHAAGNGLLAVGSHGLSHRSLAALPPEQRNDELRRSKQRIEEEIGRPCRAIAYPHGRWDAAVAQAAEAAGYACGLTTDDGLNGAPEDRFALRRTMVGDKGHFALFCARMSGAWESLRRLNPARGRAP